MRKRLLSILLTLCMVFSMLPQIALAAETINIQGVNYTIGDEVTTTGLDLNTAPSKDTYYKAGDGYILWNGYTLTMHDATIDTTTGSAFALTLKKDAYFILNLEGTSVLKAKECAIKREKSDNVPEMRFNAIGSGTLSVASETDSAMDLGGVTLWVADRTTFIVGDDTRTMGIPLIKNQSSIINSSIIKFPVGITAEEIKLLDIINNGTFMIGDTIIGIANGNLYPLSGDVTNTGLDLSVDTPTVDTYYKAHDGYLLFSPSNGTLTMNNAIINADKSGPLIKLPEKDIKLVLEGNN